MSQCVIVEGNYDKCYDDTLLFSNFEIIKQFLEKQNINVIFWNGDEYKRHSYTNILQMLLYNYHIQNVRFIALHDFESNKKISQSYNYRSGFQMFHDLQISYCVFTKPMCKYQYLKSKFKKVYKICLDDELKFSSIK